MELHSVIEWNDGDSSVNDVVVYKHPTRDFNTQTELIVHPSQVALLVSEGGYAEKPFTEGRHKLNVAKLPGITNFMNKLVRGGQNPYTAEIYFINKVYMNDLLWGTPSRITMQDPVEGVNIHVGANGLFGAHIDDETAQRFVTKVVGTRDTFSKDELAQYLRGKIIERVTDLLGKTMTQKNIGILSVAAHFADLSTDIQAQMTPYFKDYGIALDNFSFNAIQALESDLAEINKMKIEAKKMDMESEALARKRAREGYTYQQERGYDVLGTAASNEGTAGTFMGAGMGLGMGVGMGGAFGAGLAGVAQNSFQGMNQPMGQAMGQPYGMAQAPMAPPPIQQVSFFVAVNGQTTGPYDMNVLSQMVANGTLRKESLVWKQGMAAWAQAGMVPELQALFNVPPAPPAPPAPPVPPTM